jgi:hypothetical protein
MPESLPDFLVDKKVMIDERDENYKSYIIDRLYQIYQAKQYL